MLKFDVVQTDKHSIKILLRRKNLRFLRRTNHYTNTLAAMLTDPETTSCKRTIFGSTRQKTTRLIDN